MKNIEQNIEVWNTMPMAMRGQGWIKAGTTTDRSTLREIARDLFAKGATEVAFSRAAMDDVHYWFRNTEKPVSPQV